MTKSIGFIYSLSHKTRTDTPIYIGSTNCLKTRYDAHRYACNNKKQSKYNYYVYEFIRDYGGIDQWKINRLSEVLYKSKEELIKLERMFIDKYLSEDIKLLNKVIPFRTKEEYAEYYKPIQQISSMQSRIRNRDKQNQKRKEYYQSKREQIIKANREYYLKNKEKINNARKEKFNCVCGESVCRKHKKKHLKSKIHHDNLLLNLQTTLLNFNQ